MPDTALPPCSVLLLAGGRGQRMGGHDKGLLEWRGRPLISYLYEQVRPLSDDLIISCNRNAERYRPYADRLVQDDTPDYPGPLAGIRAGLAVARHPWLLVLPCDAPCIDAALLDSLRRASAAAPDVAHMLRAGEQWEPLFCMLPRSLAAPLEAAWQRGERSPRHILLPLGAQAVPCEKDDPRLINLNTPELLQGSPQE
ncbi:molybdenum cofactor guanylyltransferase MobA [Pseudomonas panipatensis]|uniref:Molybdenum cofactor guanylyltransferase n=1 Tax=Pseudomonas panipatensis TaxID=428992 RepID=A0A1G8CD31_9PSED|nr:molybdenum cofactor guanylyltransferase MobA [Pseudomonas panipatensis]SDH43417.1 molybdopterin-guanine dinucleotide biosynthesis protein A [Pseudomonas panipatensis]SMP65028.1 molybdenum cofactor guanylyltransferase [Pseudomonas panipatensis]